MISLVLKFGWRVMTSRAGLAVILCTALWAGHAIDKSRAISAARDGYVQQVELTAAQAELAELKRRASATENANRALQERVQASTGEAVRLSREIEEYAANLEHEPACVADDDFLDGLRTR